MSSAVENLEKTTGPRSVADLIPDARVLPPEQFAAQYGSGFLLVAAPKVQPAAGPCSTVVKGLTAPPVDDEATAGVSQLIHPLRRGAHSVAPFVSVGRTANNDVSFSDVTVSRFHAFFKQDREGVWRVQDAGSKNGTRLNGRIVPPQGGGEAVAVRSGDDLRFGSVELTFLDAQALHAYLLAFG